MSPLNERNRVPFQKLTVATCAMGTLTVNINNTGLNLVLPRIRDDLGLDLATMQWVSAAYVLILAALTMLGGALGDRYDKRTVLVTGILIYTFGSTVGMLADSGIWLTLSRMCAATGASVLVPVGLAALRVIAQTPEQLASYMSLWGLSVGLGMALGPVAGGIVTDLFGWRAFFTVMACLGALYLCAVLICFPELPGTKERHVDVVSHILLGSSMLALTAFFIELRSDAPAWVKVALGCAVPVCATAWQWRDRKLAHPVIPPRAFHDRSFSVSMLIAFVNYLGLGATLFVAAFVLQDLFGLTAGVAGAVSVPLAIATAVGASWSGQAKGAQQIRGAIRTAAFATLCGVLIAGGAVTLVTSAKLWVAVIVFVAGSCGMGFGFGAANTPVNYLAMASLPKTISGVAGSSASASRQLGQSTGVATGGLLLGIGVALAGVGSPLAYLLPGVEVALIAILLAMLPAFYRSRGGN